MRVTLRYLRNILKPQTWMDFGTLDYWFELLADDNNEVVVSTCYLEVCNGYLRSFLSDAVLSSQRGIHFSYEIANLA